MRNLASLTFVALILVACSDHYKYSRQISVVDSLENVVDQLEIKFDSIDAGKVEDGSKKINRLYDYLLSNYPDSVNRKFWITEANAMRRSKKAFELYKIKADEVRKEINLSKDKLRTMRNSLEDEKLDSAEVKQYMQDEVNAVKQIEFAVYKIQPEVKLGIAIWDTLYPRMLFVADSIKELK